jgi:subtilisin-like proprotein convertase family protein
MKTATKKLSILTLLAGLAGSAQAVQVFSYNTPQNIPDAFDDGGVNTPGVVSIPFALSGLGSSIADTMTVSLNISGTGGSGGYTGDLYVYLKNNNANVTSVLVNRPGDGNSANNGFDVTFSMSALPDIHTYETINPNPEPKFNGNDQLNGTWAADGRLADPNVTPTGNPGRDAKLNVFQGVNPNATWTLYVSDYSPIYTMTLNSFSVDITAVPEPAQTAIAFAGLLFGLVLYRQPQVRARLTSLVRR